MGIETNNVMFDFAAWIYVNHPDKAKEQNELIAEYINTKNLTFLKEQFFAQTLNLVEHGLAEIK